MDSGADAWPLYPEAKLRCPWCTRLGQSLTYQPELDYAICCDGPSPCTSKLTHDREPVKSKAAYTGRTLGWVFRQQPNLRERIRVLIGQYLVGNPEQKRKSLDGTLYVTEEGESVHLRTVQLSEELYRMRSAQEDPEDIFPAAAHDRVPEFVGSLEVGSPGNRVPEFVWPRRVNLWPNPLDQPGKDVGVLPDNVVPDKWWTNWKCRCCGGKIEDAGQGRDTVVYNWGNAYVGLNTPFAMGHYCRPECQGANGL
jgi:hypothetical protein